jgi:hypothetical protein
MKRKPKRALTVDYEHDIKGNPDEEKIRDVLQSYPDPVNDHDGNLLHLDAALYESAYKDICDAEDDEIVAVGKAFARLFVSLKNEEIIILAHALGGKTLRQIEASTGIPRRSIYQAILRIRETAHARLSAVVFPSKTIKFPGGELTVKYEGGL